MKILIKSQVAILASLLAAFALTLTACGGGSSSSSAGGSGSLNAATVSGTVTNGGLASLSIRQSGSLLLAISDAIVSAAHASGVANVPVSVDCGTGPEGTASTSTDGNGEFSMTVDDVGTGDCEVSVNGVPRSVPLRAGKKTEIEVTLSGGVVTFMSIDQDSSDDFGTAGALVAGEVEDDLSSDDISSDDGESDATSDEDSADNESSDASSSSSST
jgi:hypothetical protein